MYMNRANVADIKNNLKHYLDLVLQGATVTITRRNIEIAQIVPLCRNKVNKTVLGSGKGSVEFLGSITEPLIPEENWKMLA